MGSLDWADAKGERGDKIPSLSLWCLDSFRRPPENRKDFIVTIPKGTSGVFQWEMHFLLFIFRLSKTISGHFSQFSSYRNNIVFLMPVVSCGETGTEEVLSLEVLGTLAYACHTNLVLQQQRSIRTIFRNIILPSMKGIGLQFLCRGSLRCWLLTSRPFMLRVEHPLQPLTSLGT